MTFKVSLFSLLLLSSFLALASASCHVDDEAGLLGFKSGITHDPAGMLANWRPGTDCCSWEGVLCRTEGNKRVFGLWIIGSTDRYLAGQISPSLSKLQFLQVIFLYNLGNISGPVPDALFTLPNLVTVEISESKLSGQLPHLVNPNSNLQILNLENNLLTGPIPSSISQLSALINIRFAGNLLTGTIPAGIGKLKNLTELNLRQNKLSGPIPDIFSSLPNLSNIDLSGNSFSGGIPPSLPSLALLYTLDVSHNSLTGTIPDFAASTIALLNFASNEFSGTVSEKLVNLPNLDNLNVSGNQLTGPFPAINVPRPRFIDLSYNKFNLWTIPEWITSSPNVTVLRLAKCGIKFKLNDWNPVSPSTYQSLDLSDNQISGSPVSLLKRMKFLERFRASNNKLRFDMGKLKIPSADALRVLDVSRNLAYGMVRATVSGLGALNVSHNHLCGRLPPTNFPADAFIGNDCLCGPPLSPCKRLPRRKFT